MKTGCRNQVELARLLAQMPYRARARRRTWTARA
jgi:hypothetical protein